MNDETSQQFTRWFQQTTGHESYPFQLRFACDSIPLQNPSPLVGEGAGEGANEAPCLCKAGLGEVEKSGEGLLIDAPTGMGKTAMAVM